MVTYATSARCLLGAAVAVLVLTAPAAAAPTLDQQQPTLDSFGTLGISNAQGRKLAQIVTAGVAGLLAEVQLPARCMGGSQLTLEVRSAVSVPGSTVLASQTASMPFSGRNFHPVTLASPPFIAAEEPFAVVLSSAGSCDIWPGPPDADSYPRGASFSEVVGGGWFPSTRDLAFKTLVDPRCLVPALSGLRETEAQALVVKHGCATGRVVRAHSKKISRGTVVSFSPAEGTLLAPGSAVALVVSQGPQPCKVPQLRGKTLAQARAALTRANCRLGRVARRNNPGTKSGRISSQRPTPRTQRPAGTRVHVVVSR